MDDVLRIKKFSYFDTALGWELEPVIFDDFNLLVGASGAGKTMIINSILNLKRIMHGEAISGVIWDVTFDTADGKEYEWRGEFENLGIEEYYSQKEDMDFSISSSSNPNPKYLFEQILYNGQEVVRREGDVMYTHDGKHLNISHQGSMMKLLREKEVIKPGFLEFNKIISGDESVIRRGPVMSIPFNKGKLEKQYQTLESVIDAHEDIIVKLFLVSQGHPFTFEEIKEKFIELFPQVEDIRIDLKQLDKDIPFFFPFTQIKERGVDNWIPESKISSGMFRALMHVSWHFLFPKQSLILFDEFENSLGANCLYKMTDAVLQNENNHQIIITSQHPFIITRIGYERWKVVTRKGGLVCIHNAEDFNLPKSKYQSFIKLLGVDEFKYGFAQQEVKDSETKPEPEQS